MDSSQFSKNMLGNLISAYTALGRDVAFVPELLPETWEPSSEVWQQTRALMSCQSIESHLR